MLAIPTVFLKNKALFKSHCKFWIKPMEKPCIFGRKNHRKLSDILKVLFNTRATIFIHVYIRRDASEWVQVNKSVSSVKQRASECKSCTSRMITFLWSNIVIIYTLVKIRSGWLVLSDRASVIASATFYSNPVEATPHRILKPKLKTSVPDELMKQVESGVAPAWLDPHQPFVDQTGPLG